MKYFYYSILIISITAGILLSLPGRAFEYKAALPVVQQVKSYSSGSQVVTASWYDSEHCLGCRADRLMANGEKLDGDAMTCAYNHAPLNSTIKIKYQGKEVECLVADRIGIETRIDLTPAVFGQLSDLDKGLIAVELEIKK